MNLQIALDTCTSAQGIVLMKEIGSLTEIIEVGTPLIIREGVSAIAAMKAAFPRHRILADLKTMDAGEFEAEEAFAAGAHIVTVLGAAHDDTVAGCIRAARRYGGQVLADLICVADPAKRAVELEALGVDYVCVHTAFDRQASGASPLTELAAVSAVLTKAGAAVAGGLNRDTVPRAVPYNPAIIIVGGAVTGAPNPAAAAAEIREAIK